MTVVDICISAVFRRQPAGILRPIALFVTIAAVFLSWPRQVIVHVPVLTVPLSVQHMLLIHHRKIIKSGIFYCTVCYLRTLY